MQTSLKQVVILATGGTIAGAANAAEQSMQYQAGVLSVDLLLAAVPGLAKRAQVRAEQLASIDSKDASPTFLCELSNRINALLEQDDVDGVVVTHGTDTLEETAYWLQLTVGSTKPVVLTAAMRPATALSADGPANLYDAVTLAASAAAVGEGVLVTLANEIHSARDVAKISSHSINAFASPDSGPLGHVQDGKVQMARPAYGVHTSRSRFARALGWQVDWLAQVEIVMSYGGATRVFVDAARDAGVEGLVVAGTGNGTLHHTLQHALVDAASAGMTVVRSSRTAEVRVSQGGAVDDVGFGFVASGTLSPQKARILLILALSSGVTDRASLQEIFDRY